METDTLQQIEYPFIPLRPHILVEEDVSGVTVADWEIDMVQTLNTPDEVLTREEFRRPTVIISQNMPNADALFGCREDIRMLRLVPNKLKPMYDWYHSHTRDQLAHQVEEYFQHTTNFAFVRNMYPYDLPPGIDQYIAWMKNMDTPRPDTAIFIAQCARKLDVETYDLIVFERSLKTSVKMVRGSFPVYRHVHVWMRR